MTTPHQPDARYSQNFLISPQVIDQLLDHSSIGANDLVLDIGAGRGAITERLVSHCRQVIAIEKDPSLAAWLRRQFGGCPNIRLYQGDFLAFNLPRAAYKVFANIPFAITTPVLSRLTSDSNPPIDCYVVVQEEAAARFIGRPAGTLRAALLSPWFELSVDHRFRRTDFDPVPQVDVVMLRLRKRGPPLIGNHEAQMYRDFITHCFIAWRPDLRLTLNALLGPRRARSIADSSGIRRADTPSTVHVEQWIALFEAFKSANSSRAKRRVANAQRRLEDLQRALKRIHRTRSPALRRSLALSRSRSSGPPLSHGSRDLRGKPPR
jgi:23S rRNA (adenine-N6)-dimethyltransferase